MDKEKKETIQSAIEYLDRLIPGMERHIHDFRQGDIAVALRQLPDIIEGIDWLLHTVVLCQSELPVKIDITDISQHVEEMLSAIENADYVLLADLFEYEVIPVLRDWLEKMKP